MGLRGLYDLSVPMLQYIIHTGEESHLIWKKKERFTTDRNAINYTHPHANIYILLIHISKVLLPIWITNLATTVGLLTLTLFCFVLQLVLKKQGKK